MKLNEWLVANAVRRSAFAVRLGTSPGYITDLCQDDASPSLKMARRIMLATNGEVGLGDWQPKEVAE